jgi:signal transduction histidine kinase
VAWFVSDDGIGMTQDEVAQLFTKYFRAKNDSVRNVQGTGLGLVITRSIVELHGGLMSVESEHGAGTTFGFTLPVRA